GTCSSCFLPQLTLLKVFLEAGAKVQLLFSTGKKILKFFLEIFLSPFLLFSHQSVKELCAFCGVQM
ncbi:hypothetical protein, partial [Flavobacterium yafengii]|uniref:hypothetical protein n=1 Tax=Flavobacterium yafengii TaxID=3041253 RepID=UPI0024A851F7